MYSKPQQHSLTPQAAEIIDQSAQIPQAVEIEKIVLGVLLVDNDTMSQQAKLLLCPEVFYDPSHSLIFSAIKQLDEQGKKSDLQTVGLCLKEQNRLSAIGGMVYLVVLTQLAGSGATLTQHIQILIQAHISRQVLQASYNATRQILSGDVDIADTIRDMTARIEQAQLGVVVGASRRHIAEIAVDAIEAAHKREERYLTGKAAGITTGLRVLDQLTSGWQAGQLIVLAARPAMGKTAAMIHLMRQAALQGIAVCAYSLEMTGISLLNRMLVAQSGGRVNADNLRRGRLSAEEWAELDAAEKSFAKLPIYIDDRSNVSMQYIATHSRMMNKQGKCGIVFIDYLQLMDTRTAERGRNREQEVAQCSKAAKVLAKELGVPVVLLAQLNRAVEGRGGKEPMLSDLRESGAIEQDADIVMFVHRPEYYEKDKQEVETRLSDGQKHFVPIKGLGKFIVAKNREGSTGDAKFSYNESLTVITDFDERPYLHSTTVAYGGRREVGPNSIHYTPPADSLNPSEQVPF